MSYNLNCVNNKGIDRGIDTKDFEFIKRQNMEINKEFTVRGIFFHNKSKFGKAGVVILDDCFVDLPEHQMEGIESLLKEPEFIEDIKAGKISIKPYLYDTDTRKDCVGFEFIN